MFLIQPCILAQEKRLNIKSSISAETIYDSNLFLTPTNAEDDFIVVLHPDLLGAYYLRIGDLSFGYRSRLYIPLKNFSDDNLSIASHQAHIRLSSYITNRLFVEIEDVFESVNKDIGKPADQVSNILNSNVTRLKIRQEIPLSQRINFNAGLSAARNEVLSTNSDNFNFTGSVELVREMNTDFTLGLTTRGAMLLYDDPSFEDTTIVGLQVEGKKGFFTKLKLTVPAGVELLLLETNGQAWAANIDPRIRYLFSQRTELSLGIDSGFTVDANGNNFRSFQFNNSISHEFTETIEASLNLSYLYYRSGLLNDQHDTVYKGGFLINYQALSSLEAFTGVNFFFNRGERTQNDFDQYQIYVGVRCTLF